MSQITAVQKHQSDYPNSTDSHSIDSNVESKSLLSLSTDPSPNHVLTAVGSTTAGSENNESKSLLSPSATNTHKNYSTLNNHFSNITLAETRATKTEHKTLTFFLNMSAVTMVASGTLLTISALLTSISAEWAKDFGEIIRLAAIALLGVGTSFIILSTLASVTPLFNKLFTCIDSLVTSRSSYASIA
ncbi:hypothetical protein [Candidatus Ichthyocystis hellenicum]|uniref:hypothetical protein n=1 Tax=Candidatus Ichthyocystis hellenicum TaxID=1561003 RepID=UPI000B80F5A5|nr:hypothetical protein [Candidatus Ichthyocystis hellenicum]